jgi:hypothetical protein
MSLKSEVLTNVKHLLKERLVIEDTGLPDIDIIESAIRDRGLNHFSWWTVDQEKSYIWKPFTRVSRHLHNNSLVTGCIFIIIKN